MVLNAEMNKAKRERIGDAAEKIRSVLRLTSPISIEQLIDAVGRLGGVIVDVDSGSSGNEASILKHGAQFEIRLDREKPRVRQAFSIAHELGHLFLHMGFGQPKWGAVQEYVESYARSGYTEEEFEANEFAAALLMPVREFRDVAQSSTTQDVAEHFGVSYDAALNRGRWLGFYSWS